jgi:DNA-binding NarL/FixJ family response regulator
MPPGEHPAVLRVVVAEDSYLVREGVRRLLESTGRVKVVAAVPTAVELVDAVSRLHPDAVLTDIRMPPGHSTEGIRAAHAIRSAHPEVGVVVLSQHADAGYVLELLKHGADGLGYLLKERIGDRDQMVSALLETCPAKSTEGWFGAVGCD